MNDETSSAMKALRPIKVSNRYGEQVQKQRGDINLLESNKCWNTAQVRTCEDNVGKEVSGMGKMAPSRIKERSIN